MERASKKRVTFTSCRYFLYQTFLLFTAFTWTPSPGNLFFRIVTTSTWNVTCPRVCAVSRKHPLDFEDLLWRRDIEQLHNFQKIDCMLNGNTWHLISPVFFRVTFQISNWDLHWVSTGQCHPRGTHLVPVAFHFWSLGDGLQDSFQSSEA